MVQDRPNSPVTTGNRQEPMQRIRVGVTGLAAVILIVALATAIASGIRRSANANMPAAAQAAAQVTKLSVSNAVDPRSEPLAQLGVAPGANERKDIASPNDKRSR